MDSKSRVRYTTIVNKYPSYRDDILKSCWRWLEGRCEDDNAERLWRIHDKIYNLNDFIEKHPGGSEWLIYSKGTDITEAFESYHILPKASQVLQKFYVKEAHAPRNYRITFNENGFYQTLKRRVAEKIPTLDRSDLQKSKPILDILLVSFLVASIMTMRCESFMRIFLIFFAAISGTFLQTASHNFVHQRNNWRMYTANLMMSGWRDWRVFHGLSHHQYPNSYADFEVTAFEPFLPWLPDENRKNWRILFSYIITPFAYSVFSHVIFLRRYFGFLFAKSKVFYYYDEFLVYLPPTLMYCFGNSTNIQSVIITWTVIIIISSFFYSITGLNAGHHGCEIVHEGDEVKSLDFGIYQMAATVDRIEPNENLILSLTNFGEHTLHHLFPSLDHALLPQLKGILLETCREFDLELREYTFLYAMIDQFKQLARKHYIRLD